jgi:hypothetical protein
MQNVKLCTGTVQNVLRGPNLVEVKTDLTDKTIMCAMAINPIASLLGISVTSLPTTGTNVVVLYSGEDEQHHFIIGCLPNGLSLEEGQHTTVTDADQYVTEATGDSETQEKHFIGHRPPKDIVEGEYHVANDYGIALSLLKHIAKLGAGELAKIECHLMDDMVRIISDKFKHHTAFGDYEIYNDQGKLNVKWMGTDKDYEALGMEDPEGTAKFEANADKNITTEDSVEEKWKDSGRWRFQTYIGHLGNFLNFFLSDPIKHLSDAAGVPSGKFRMHVNDDGGFLLQSLADITLERVVKIPVPVEINRYDDPERIIDSKNFAGINKDELAKWKPSSTTKLHEAVYQLKDYARWYSHVYSMAQFHIDPRYQVLPDSQYQYPDKDSESKERKKANDVGGYNPETHVAYQYKYATIRIMKDASVLVMDGDGSAINMSNKDVTVSAARNLNLEAANHITMNAGNDILVKARRSVDVSAIKGGMFLRSRAYLQALCEKGSIFAESGAKPLYTPEEKLLEEVTPRVIDGQGVVLKTPLSGIKAAGFEDVSLATKTGKLLLSGQVGGVDIGGRSIKLNQHVEVAAGTVKINGLTDIARLRTFLLTQYTDSLTVPIKPLSNPPEAIIEGLNEASSNALLTDVTAKPIQDTPSNLTEYQSVTQQKLENDLATNATSLGLHQTARERLTVTGTGRPFPGDLPLKSFKGSNPALNEDAGSFDNYKNKSSMQEGTTFNFIYQTSLVEKVAGKIGDDSALSAAEGNAVTDSVKKLSPAELVQVDSVMAVAAAPLNNVVAGAALTDMGGALQGMTSFTPESLTNAANAATKLTAATAGVGGFSALGAVNSGINSALGAIGNQISSALNAIPGMEHITAGLSAVNNAVGFTSALKQVASLPANVLKTINPLPKLSGLTSVGTDLLNTGKAVTALPQGVTTPGKAAANYLTSVKGETNSTIQSAAKL